MGSPHYHSAKYGLVNILIGVGRGYKKEQRRIMRGLVRKGGDISQEMIARMFKQRAEFVEDLAAGLGDYYPEGTRKQVAEALFDMIVQFEEQR